MSASARRARSEKYPKGLLAEVRERWRAADPWLPEPVPFGDAELIHARADGYLACGAVGEVTVEPDWYDALWGPLDRYLLRAHVAGDVAAGLDMLLRTWRDVLAERVPAGTESAAMIGWPSREIDGCRALYAHGFAPYSVLAVRPAGRGWPEVRPADLGIDIDRAAAADLPAVVELWAELHEEDVRVGSLIPRRGGRQLMTEDLARVLAEPDPWLWLARRGGRPIALAAAVSPADSGWIAPQVRGGPVGYLASMGVTAGERGGGVGAALAGWLHAHLDAAGVGCTLLHHAQVNPRSAPFWHRMGYRPLWTSWQVRPASAVR